MSGQAAADALAESMALVRRNTSANLGMWIASAFVERFGDDDGALADAMLAMLEDTEWRGEVYWPGEGRRSPSARRSRTCRCPMAASTPPRA